jgi:hypothetical protein
MLRLDTRKISLSGLTLFPKEGSPFTSTLEIDNVPLIPDMENWYGGLYQYESPAGSWEMEFDEEPNNASVKVRLEGGSADDGDLYWRVVIEFQPENRSGDSFVLLRQSGDEVYENPWLVPQWNIVLPDTEDGDYPWTDYLDLEGDVVIMPVDEGSFTLPYKSLSAIQVTESDPATFFTTIGEGKTFVLSGTYIFDSDKGIYIHEDPDNSLNGDAPSLYFYYDPETQSESNLFPVSLRARIFSITGPGSTSTITDLGYIPDVLDRDLEDIQISDWESDDEEVFVGMLLLGLLGEVPEEPGSEGNTFGLPADVVALITSRHGSVSNFLRLRNQGQI